MNKKIKVLGLIAASLTTLSLGAAEFSAKGKSTEETTDTSGTHTHTDTHTPTEKDGRNDQQTPKRAPCCQRPRVENRSGWRTPSPEGTQARTQGTTTFREKTVAAAREKQQASKQQHQETINILQGEGTVREYSRSRHSCGKSM